MIGFVAGTMLMIPVWALSDASWVMIPVGGVLGVIFEAACRLGARNWEDD